jgi:ribosomal protein S18 acetylase RimI-like enzyme
MTEITTCTTPASAGDRDDVIDLWTRCGLTVPHNPPAGDFELALGKPGSDILVTRQDNRIIGTVMVGHDGHRGWIYYLAVDPGYRHQGLGERLVRAAESWIQDRGVRKIQLMVRSSNRGVLDFYRAIGYDQSDVTVMQRWLDPAMQQP